MILSKILIEAKADVEYERGYSDIPRDIFDAIIKADPKTLVDESGNPSLLGYGAKQLLLRLYKNGDTAFVNDLDNIKNHLSTYYDNLKTYDQAAKNLNVFQSIADFLAFVDNPDPKFLQTDNKKEEDKITSIYNKYYASIPRDVFDSIIAVDPETSETSIGRAAKNLLLPKYLKGDTNFINDLDRVKEAIKIFYEDSETYPAEFQNIEAFGTVDDFLHYVLSDTDSALVAELKANTRVDQVTKKQVKDDVRFVATTPEYDIIQPLSAEAARAITKNDNWHNTGNNAMRWCTGSTNFGDKFWNDYKRDGGQIYCFMHKTKNYGAQNRPLNWQLAVRHGNPYEFRDGSDNSIEFDDFLFSHPVITKALGKVEPFSSMECVRDALDELQLVDKPLEINKLQDFVDLSTKSPKLKNIVSEISINGVRYIPANTFANFISLSKLSLNAPLEIIGDQAFLGCSSLNNLRFPDTLTEIRSRAFAGCIHLKNNIRVPDSLKKIGRQAFLDTHCKLSILKDRAERGLPLEVSAQDKDWYLSHLRGVNE